MRTTLSLLLLLLSIAPVMAQGETRRYFQDWLAACRADGYCSATAYENPNPGDGRVADYIFRVGRHVGAEHWELSFIPVKVMADPDAPFSVDIDGVAVGFSGSDEIQAHGSINDFYLLGNAVQTVFDRMAPGRRIEVAFTDTEGAARRSAFSLAGLTAALLWMDEQQDRIGSGRIAGAPPVGVEPVGMQTGAAELPQALLAFIAADPECRPFTELANGEDIEIDPELGPGQRLFILPCWSAAYNFGWKVFVESSGEISQIALPEYSLSTGWTATTSIVNYWYDPETKELGSFNKGRGIGDCGTLGRWAWQDYRFRLTEYSSKEECDGEVGDFPVVYQLQP